jgi:predicted metal-dependent hydrolase
MRKQVSKPLNKIGLVTFVPSRRARHLRISVKSSAGVHVVVPSFMSLPHAERFVFQKQDWVLKQQRKFFEWEKEFALYRQNKPLPSEPEAHRFLKERLEQLARRFGFTYNRVSLRRQKTRWGSCSGNNNISLNLKLALLPDPLRDYVIFHELVHTRIANHGREFWLELNRYVGDAKELRGRLRRIPL